jgi:hypothetical protein
MYVIIRKMLYGPFKTPAEAVQWADKKWPSECHSIQVLRVPD